MLEPTLLDARAIDALRRYVATLPHCNHYTFRDTPGAARPHEMVLCRATALWHDSGLWACDEHGGATNPWRRPLVEIRGAAELRELLAVLVTAGAADRGRLMITADRAADARLDALAKLADITRNPKAGAVARDRAARTLAVAEGNKLNADAALEAAGGRYNMCLIPSDHPSQIEQGT